MRKNNLKDESRVLSKLKAKGLLQVEFCLYFHLSLLFSQMKYVKFVLFCSLNDQSNYEDQVSTFYFVKYQISYFFLLQGEYLFSMGYFSMGGV